MIKFFKHINKLINKTKNLCHSARDAESQMNKILNQVQDDNAK